MDPGFRGEVADFYHKYRRGYPPAVIAAVADAFQLTGDDVVVDVGCGTGQLTLPVAARVRAVAGVDPEPDMLARARRAARDQGIANVSWLIGTDTDIPAIRALLGFQRAGAVTIAQALHWMNHDELFRAAIPLVRPGGGIAVITNGTPLWLQDTAWSRALRRFLEQWFDTTITATCGTDAASQRRYRDSLTAAGYEVTKASVRYSSRLTVEQVVGGIYSAFSVGQLPAPDERPRFAEQIRRALQPHEPVTEHVRVAMLLGCISPGHHPPGWDKVD
jgi:SAM-dependent methyltransferase